MVAADLSVERADQEPVQPQQADQQVAQSAHRPSPVPCGSTEAPLQTTVELRAEFRVRRARRRREGADDHVAAGRESVEALAAQVPEPALDPVRGTALPTDPADDEPDPGRVASGRAPGRGRPGGRRRCGARADDASDVTAVGEPMRRGEHGRGVTSCGSSRAGSDSQALAALAATRGQDGAAGAGAHAQAEAVHLVATAVVRLVRTLAHGSLRWWSGAVTPAAARSPVGDGQRWSKLVTAIGGFGRHRPPTRRWSGPGRLRAERGHAAPVDTG